MPENPDTISLLVQLLNTELNLKPGRVRRYNQRAVLPQDPGLFIDVAYLTSHTFGRSAVSKSDPVTGNLNWVQTINRREFYALMLMSVNSGALDRLSEILMVFESDTAIKLMDQYNFQIAPITSDPADLSEVEGPSRLNRYEFHVSVLRAYTYVKAVTYYDEFTGSPALVTQP